MKKLIFMLICISTLLTLASCGAGAGQSDVPKGYIAASDPDRDGYSLYVPEGWTYYREGNTNRAYISNVDRTSVTARVVDTDLSPAGWWEAAQADFARDFAEYTVESVDTAAKIDKRDAVKAKYSVKIYEGSYGFVQAIIRMSDDRLLVVTCQASKDKQEYQTDTPYNYHIESLLELIELIKINGTPASPDEPSFEGEAPQGMKLAGDAAVLGMYFYVPADYTIDYSTGEISASAADGTTVRVAEVTPPSEVTKVDEYFAYLIAQYRAQFDSVEVHFQSNEAVSIGGCPAYLCTMSVTEDGQVYSVSQYIITKKTGLRTGIYLLTFAARAENAEAHSGELGRIIGAVKFK